MVNIFTIIEESQKAERELYNESSNHAVVVLCPYKPNAKTYSMDISKAKKELDYKPAYDYIQYLIDFKKEINLGRFNELQDK